MALIMGAGMARWLQPCYAIQMLEARCLSMLVDACSFANCGIAGRKIPSCAPVSANWHSPGGSNEPLNWVPTGWDWFLQGPIIRASMPRILPSRSPILPILPKASLKNTPFVHLPTLVISGLGAASCAREHDEYQYSAGMANMLDQTTDHKSLNTQYTRLPCKQGIWGWPERHSVFDEDHRGAAQTCDAMMILAQAIGTWRRISLVARPRHRFRTPPRWWLCSPAP